MRYGNLNLKELLKKLEKSNIYVSTRLIVYVSPTSSITRHTHGDDGGGEEA